MASQLIYTSAPRLLEAGRTGFGTVARHRSVSGLLASAVERFSQFARLPGHDPKRVVHSHRLVTVGASTFHVLSCLRDAGSDYTGRTNHIAHHLIADEREVRALAAEGISPADVLLAMPWRETWTEAARFLEPADEVDLADLRAGSSRTWEAATGDQNNARLPWLPGARKGCYVIAPDGVPMLALFQEALHEKIQQAWQVTFTTSLEPNDDVADFRWIGVTASSPLRVQLENSVRQVFDLEVPGSLPAPPEEEVAAMPVVPPRPAGALPPPPPVLASPAKETLPAPHLRTRGGVVPPPSLAELPPPSPAGVAGEMLGGWSPEPRSRRGGKSRMPLVLGALVLLLLAAGAGLVFFKLQQDRENQEGGNQLAAQIETLLERHALNLPKTEDSLVARAQNSDEAGRGELKKVLAAYAAEFQKIDASLADPGIPYAPTSSPDVNHQDDLVGLWKVVGEWTKTSAATMAERWEVKSKPAEMSHDVESWLKQRAELWKQCADFFKPSRPEPDAKPEWQIFLAKAKEILGGETRPAGTPQEWRDHMTRIENGLGRKPLADVSAWLDAWTRLAKAEGGKSADRAAESKAIAGRPGLPAWLKAMADAQGKKSEAEVVVVKEKMPERGPPVGLVLEPAVDVNSAAASHPIYITFVPADEKETTLRVSLLEDNPKPTLSFGGTAPDFASLEKWTFFDTSYKLKRMNVADGEIKINGAEMSLPMRVNATRLVARTEDEKKVLFEARLIASNSPLAPLLKFTEVPEFKVSDTNAVQYLDIGRLIQRLQFIKAPNVEYRLSSKHGGGLQFQLSRPTGNAYILSALVPSASTSLVQNQKAFLEKEIAEIKKAIAAREAEIKVESGKNTAERQKKEKLETLRKSIGIKENELKLKEQALAALQAPVTTSAVRIAPGRYILRAHFSSTDVPAVKDVCEIQVNLP